MNHFVNKCKHGTVLGQCRCPDPNKTVQRVPCVASCPADAEAVVVDQHLAADRELRYVRAREALTQAQQKMLAAIMRYALGVDAAQKDLAAAEEALRRG